MIQSSNTLKGCDKGKNVDLYSIMPQDRIRTNGWKLYRERYKLKIRKDFLTERAVKQRKQPTSWSHGGFITEDFQTDVVQPFDWDGLRIPPLYRSYSRRHPSSLSTLHCYGFVILCFRGTQ